ncbi:MAG: anthranilate synthase component I, partial [Phycisphaerales bacterium]|nr:anthranilate synthase component I [Phycisphaerales bacterium]
MSAPFIDLGTFRKLAGKANVIALTRRLMSDQLTPVLGYRRLVAADERTAPSFLFESVESGAAVGRHSYIGAQPSLEVVAQGDQVRVIDSRGRTTTRAHEENPFDAVRKLTAQWRVAPERATGSMRRFTGGWVGYAGYDTVRYLEPDKLPFGSAPLDDRNLPEMHFGLYRQVGAFDHVEKVLYAIVHVVLEEHGTVDRAYAAGVDELEQFVDRLELHSDVPLPVGRIDLAVGDLPPPHIKSNLTREEFQEAVGRCKQYISAGDAFQVVMSQRFERRTRIDPFEIYRALRIVNPSPYMIYLQARGSILVASSPEILCRCQDGEVTNRPLAGTRRRGSTVEEDKRLEMELRADAKERAEHVMLVDLGRNDLGRVCRTGSIELQRIMDVERYSHVMHLSSTVTGRLREGLDCWDALRHTLPAGTVSGAPKVRAMQIIDELEPTRRGPYGGGIGAVGFNGDMDIALALRTMVIPTGETLGSQPGEPLDASGRDQAGPEWTVHLQAGAGIVADSVPEAEYEETVNKAGALGRA